jgi:purine nucleoside permease
MIYVYGATGEIAAIKNCTAILTDPNGKFRMTASEAQAAFVDLTLYTNAESCPMVCGIRHI